MDNSETEEASHWIKSGRNIVYIEGTLHLKLAYYYLHEAVRLVKTWIPSLSSDHKFKE